MRKAVILVKYWDDDDQALYSRDSLTPIDIKLFHEL